MLAPVEVDLAVLDLAISTGWLLEADASNPRKVGAAISRMLADAARRR